MKGRRQRVKGEGAKPRGLYKRLRSSVKAVQLEVELSVRSSRESSVELERSGTSQSEEDGAVER